jgi:hypothetical protein
MMEIEQENKDQMNEAAKKAGKSFGKGINETLESLRVLRWHFILHKMCRALDLYSERAMPEPLKRLEKCNDIYRTFLQAMAYH